MGINKKTAVVFAVVENAILALLLYFYLSKYAEFVPDEILALAAPVFYFFIPLVVYGKMIAKEKRNLKIVVFSLLNFFVGYVFALIALMTYATPIIPHIWPVSTRVGFGEYLMCVVLLNGLALTQYTIKLCIAVAFIIRNVQNKKHNDGQ